MSSIGLSGEDTAKLLAAISYSELNAGCQFSKSNFETTIESNYSLHMLSLRRQRVWNTCVYSIML